MSEVEPRAETIDALRGSRRVAALTGAGISAESGLETFRGKGGIWEKYDFNKLATLEGFLEDPCLVWSWYDERRLGIYNSGPNMAHEALAELEARADEFALITQNIDGYHREAGSRNVIELHGNIWRARCMGGCQTIEFREVPLSTVPPLCKRCGELLRPDVVWFGEPLPTDAIDRGLAAAAACDLMLVVGTSGTVQPAASIPVYAKRSGAYVLEVNTEPTPLSKLADDSVYGKAGDVLPALLEMARGRCGHDG